MDTSLATSMFSLVEALVRKERKSGPEHMAQVKGVEFVEKYFTLNTLLIDGEIKRIRGEDEEDTQRTPTGSLE
jgi:hypothetical protein